MTDVRRRRGGQSADPTKWETGSGLASIRLQKPEWVFFAGEVRPWEDAVLHIASEAVVRGLNVFEGLKGYWQSDGGFGYVHLRRHYARLARSARLMHIPVPVTYDEFEQACIELTRKLYRPDKEFYVRAMLMVVEGHYGAGTVADLVLTGYQQDRGAPKPIAIGVSTWRRTPDDVMPARIKAGANYQIARIARIEGRGRGYEDMILLNSAGRVSESTGACVLMVRDGELSTTPTWEGAMESITVAVLREMATSEGIDLVYRPIDRSELHVADEFGLTGTLTEITLVNTVDEYRLPDEQPILSSLLQRYLDAVTGVNPHPAVELAMVPSAQ
jgi:branched-chain amino acid aminotransferase